MDNKYGLAGSKVANEYHQAHRKIASQQPSHCKFCQHAHLLLSQTMHDHRCVQCGKWQNDVPIGYSTGRSSDY